MALDRAACRSWALSPDGKRLVTLESLDGWIDVVTLWDVAARKADLRGQRGSSLVGINRVDLRA